MVRRIFEVESRSYLFAPDDAPPLARRVWALVRARAVDEITGRPPLGGVEVETDETDMTPRVAAGGLVGLVGVPAKVFPDLAVQNYQIEMTVRAAGYVPRRETVTVAQNAAFPASFVPTDIGDLAMHREPVVIRGRAVLAAGGATTPVAGATVSVTGVWRTLPPSSVVVPADPPRLVSLSPRAYFTRPAVAGRVRRRQMTPVAGEDKTLLAAARAGDDSVRITDRINLNVGNVVSIDAADPARTEFMTVAGVVGATTDAEPATVTLTYPLMNSHPAGAVVRRVTPQPAGGDNQLNRGVIPGDACVFLNSMNDLGAPAEVVEMTGGGAPDEYHLMSRFNAVSDAGGYFRLPPLSRVAQLEIEADDLVHTVVQLLVAPDYAAGGHRIDLVFR